DKGMDGILDLPDLSLGSPAIGRRIHDNGIVVVSAADLPLYELGTVVHQPSYGRVLQTGGDSILLRPGDHTLGGVHVGHRSSCRSCSQSGAASVGKKVQYLDRPPCLSDLFRKPIPVGSLLREKSGVLEAEGLQIKCQIPVVDGPLGGEVQEFPLSAALLAAVIVGIAFPPALQCLWGIPDDLGVRPDQEIIPPAFQFFALTAV